MSEQNPGRFTLCQKLGISLKRIVGEDAFLFLAWRCFNGCEMLGGCVNVGPSAGSVGAHFDNVSFETVNGAYDAERDMDLSCSVPWKAFDETGRAALS